MDVPDDPADRDHDGEPDRDSGGDQPDDLQRDTAVEPIARGGVLQLLGFGTSVSLCKRADGEKRKNTNNCVCVVWSYCYHHISAVGGYKSTTRNQPDWWIFSVSLN